MTEHEELVADIPHVEQMATAERLKLARKRRQQQLKKFSQYEKQLDKEQNKNRKSKNAPSKHHQKASHSRHVCFVNNVMLLEAGARNDVDEVRKLLNQGISPDVTNEDGLTALHQCCIDDLEEMLRLLLEFKANVNSKDSELWTPLHAAATCGHIHLCRILIDNGADLLAVNADGNMPYDICDDEATLDFIEGEMSKNGVTQDGIDAKRLSAETDMLVDMQNMSNNGDDLEVRGRVGETPLHIAAANGFVGVAEFLLRQHVCVDAEDEDSWQPVHAAACWGHLPVLELLAQHGADVEAKTRNGETPFDICEDVEMKERIVELKTELATKGSINRKPPERRRSTNTRSSVASNSSTSLYNSNTSLVDKTHSSSVRRTSMREKSAISWKEAMEEGRRFRESLSSNDGEGEEVTSNDETPSRPEDVRLQLDNPPTSTDKTSDETPTPSDESSTKPAEESRRRKPGSSFRESENIFAPAADTLPKQPKSDLNPPPQVISTKSVQAPPPPVTTSRDVARQQDNSNMEKSKMAEAKPTNGNKASTTTLTPTATTTSKVQNDASKPTPKQNTLNMSINDLDQSPRATRHKTSSKEGLPKAIVRPTPQQSAKNGPSSSPSSPTTPKEVSSAAKKGDTSSSSAMYEDVEAAREKEAHKMATDERALQRPTSTLPGGPGTLLELKKQRAQAMQEKLSNSLRFKDREALNEELQKHGDVETGRGNGGAGDPTTGQESLGAEQNGRHNNNNVCMPLGERSSSKKYKFTTTTVVGDSDSNSDSCCVLQ